MDRAANFRPGTSSNYSWPLANKLCRSGHFDSNEPRTSTAGPFSIESSLPINDGAISDAGQDSKLLRLEAQINRLVESSWSMASQSHDLPRSLATARQAVELYAKLRSTAMNSNDIDSAANPLRESFQSASSMRSQTGSSTTTTTSHASSSNFRLGSANLNQANFAELELMVTSNFAHHLALNKKHDEAIELYSRLCKMANDRSTSGGSESTMLLHRFGLDIGNSLYELGDFSKALKYYRLTLDRIVSQAFGSKKFKSLTLKLEFNISLCLAKLGSIKEATAVAKRLLGDNVTQEVNDTTGDNDSATIYSAKRWLFLENLVVFQHEQQDLSGMIATLRQQVMLGLGQHFVQLPVKPEDLQTRVSDKLELKLNKVKEQNLGSLLFACNCVIRLVASKSKVSGHRAISLAHKLLKSILSHNKSHYQSLANDLHLSRGLEMLRSRRHVESTMNLLRKLNNIADGSELASIKSNSIVVKGLFKASDEKHDESSKFAETLKQKLAATDSKQSGAFNWINLANFHLMNQQMVLANECLQEALRLAPTSWLANYNLAILVRRSLDEGDDGSFAIKDFATSNRRDEHLSKLIGITNNLDTSNKLLARGMVLDKMQVAIAYQTCSRTQTQTSEQKQPSYGQLAMQILLELSAANPNGRQEQWPEVSLLASWLQPAEVGIKTLQQANRQYPSHLGVIERLVALNIANFRYDDAKSLLANCIRIRPDQVKWLQMLAECHRRATEYDKAIDVYKQAIDAFPRELNSLRSLIKLCKELGMNDDARAYETKLAKTMQMFAQR